MDVSASGEVLKKQQKQQKKVVLYLIPKGARFEINHNCHASVLLADRLPYALS